MDNNNNKSGLSNKNSLGNSNFDNPSSSFNATNKSAIASSKLGNNGDNLGRCFIRSLFDTFVNDVLLEIKEYLQKNFYDRKGILQKSFYEDLKTKYALDSDSKININQDIYLFACEDEFFKCFAHFREFRNYTKAIDFVREQSPVERVF